MKRRALLALIVMISISGFSILGCGGSKEPTIPEGASSVQAPTDDPAQEDAAKLADGP